MKIVKNTLWVIVQLILVAAALGFSNKYQYWESIHHSFNNWERIGCGVDACACVGTILGLFLGLCISDSGTKLRPTSWKQGHTVALQLGLTGGLFVAVSVLAALLFAIAGLVMFFQNL